MKLHLYQCIWGNKEVQEAQKWTLKAIVNLIQHVWFNSIKLENLILVLFLCYKAYKGGLLYQISGCQMSGY